MEFPTFVLYIFACFCSCVSHRDLSNGWNDKIKWLSLEDALTESERMNKPVMLIIHKSWCGACKALKPKFAASHEIAELSSNFLMVNTLDNDEPKDAKYSPDGGYIPRILFIQNGEVIPDLYHEDGNPKYKFYYHDTTPISKVMKKAIATLHINPSQSMEKSPSVDVDSSRSVENTQSLHVNLTHFTEEL